MRSQGWNLDVLGNFDSVTTDSVTQTRSHDAQNEITSISGATTPTYDANGNMTGDETGKQFVYDAWNRLVKVKDSGGNTLETFGVDALSRRVSITAGGTTTDLYYSSQWQVLEERVSGNATAQYVWSPVYIDAMILRDRDTDANGSLDERLYVQQDANWNVTAIVNGSGSVVERYAYDPFGSATVFDASWGSRSSSSYAWLYLHQGGRYDATSGLYYFRNRDYSPTLGRWLQPDAIGFEARDTDLYRCEANVPTDAVDPSGSLTLNIIAPMNPKLQLTQRGAYGVFAWPADFELSEGAPCDGVIVQRLRVVAKSGKNVKEFPSIWEFWNVKQGEKTATPKFPFPFLIEFGRLQFPNMDELKKGEFNDWYSYTGPGKPGKAGSIYYYGMASFAEGKPPNLPGATNKPIGNTGLTQLVIPVTNATDFPLRIWFGRANDTEEVAHIYLATWDDKGATTIVEHVP